MSKCGKLKDKAVRSVGTWSRAEASSREREGRMEVMPGLPEYSYPFTQITREAERTNAKCQSIVYNDSVLLHFNTFFSKEQRRHHNGKRS